MGTLQRSLGAPRRKTPRNEPIHGLTRPRRWIAQDVGMAGRGVSRWVVDEGLSRSHRSSVWGVKVAFC